MTQFPTHQIKGKTVEYKTYSFLVKSVDQDEGIVTYLASPITEDRQRDIVEPGAYAETLQAGQSRMQRGRKFICASLWMHDNKQPTGGVISGRETPEGLEVSIQYDITTNSAGFPNNQTATMVFSGAKIGYVDESSVGYVAVKYFYDKQHVRHITQMDLIEVSGVTMGFAANPDALVTGVKTMETKNASGKTSWPLADRDTKWDAGQAKKDIQAWANGDWSKVAQCFFWVAKSPPEKLEDCKLPFVAKDGDTMKAIPQGIISCAGVLQGAMGGADLGGDEEAVKKKVAAYYKQMDMTPPWEDKDKTMKDKPARKDFNDIHQSGRAADCLEDWCDLLNESTQAIIQIFSMSDSPEADMKDYLEQFSQTVMEEWLPDAIAANVGQYLSNRGYGTDNTPYVPYSMRVGGYSTRHDTIEGKVGAVLGATTRGKLAQHQDEMKAMLDEHKSMVNQSCKAMMDKVASLSNLGSNKPDDQEDDEQTDDGKSLTRQLDIKTLTLDDLASLLV